MARRDWKAFDWARAIVVSASQIENHLSCPRRWFFRSVEKLPELKKRSTAAGDCFHALAENYLRADDSGRGPDGRAIDLFPEGWEQGLDLLDAALVRVAFEAAVDKQLIRRIPGRQVEKSFQFDAGPGSVMGFMDVGAVNAGRVTVEDHKTTRSLRYAITREEMRTDVQMIVGAHAMLQLAEREGVDVESVWLRHNIAELADPVRLKAVEVSITPAHVRKVLLEKVVPEVEAMLRLKRSGAKLSEWDQLPGPRVKDACTEYGGCTYAPICSRMETPDRYRDRITKLNSQPDSIEQEVMALFDKHGALFGASPTPTATAQAPAAKVEGPAPAQSAGPGAPWANPGCFVCQGKGVRKGVVCVACDASVKSRGVRPSSDFKVTFDVEGVLSWTDGTPAGTGSLGTIVPAQMVRPQAPPPVQAVLVSQDPTTPAVPLTPGSEELAAAIDQQREVVQQVAAEKRGPGRPKGSKNKPKDQAAVSLPQPAPEQYAEASSPQPGLTVAEAADKFMSKLAPKGFMLVRGNPQKVARGIPYVLLMDLLQAAVAQVAADQKVQSFWGIKFFDRKDLLTQKLQHLSSLWPDGTVVFVPPLEAVEFREAVDALSMHPRCILDARGTA